MARLIIIAIVLTWGAKDALGQSVTSAKVSPKFLGREVIISESATAPASVCVEGPPQRQCYTAPEPFGHHPQVTVVQLNGKISVLFFSAATDGVSGWRIHFALLLPGDGKDLTNLFLADTSVSNQSQHGFWAASAISEASIFLTADYVLGPGESHYDPHRYIVSAYVLKPSSLLDDSYYYLEDRYMTARRYDVEVQADILKSEKQEILNRLSRRKATSTPQR